MTKQPSFLSQPIDFSSAGKRMLIGGGIALVFIVLFLMGVNSPKPEWGKFWMLRPLVLVPLAGAAGGFFFYFVRQQPIRHTWQKAGFTILGVVGYLIAFWLGVVLGLDGTLWD